MVRRAFRIGSNVETGDIPKVDVFQGQEVSVVILNTLVGMYLTLQELKGIAVNTNVTKDHPVRLLRARPGRRHMSADPSHSFLNWKYKQTSSNMLSVHI